VKRALAATGLTIVGLTGIAAYRVSPHSWGGVATAPPTASPASPSASPSTAPTAIPSTLPTPLPLSGGFTGSDFPNRFGDVVVRVVITNGHITDVQALQLPNDRAQSAYISEVAGPMLRSEVLKAQSAQIDLISGATYTSESYAESVESALRKAHMG
jgi:uncharacterized protein with FMN-binding domain